MNLSLTVLPGRYAVCRLEPGDAIPAWALAAPGYWSVTRTPGELSVVCDESVVPAGVRCAAGWKVLEIEGPFDFSAVGVLVSVAEPLARADVSIFAISTFDTDAVLVNEASLEDAIAALVASGHRVKR